MDMLTSCLVRSGCCCSGVRPEHADSIGSWVEAPSESWRLAALAAADPRRDAHPTLLQGAPLKKDARVSDLGWTDDVECFDEGLACLEPSALPGSVETDPLPQEESEAPPVAADVLIADEGPSLPQGESDEVRVASAKSLLPSEDKDEARLLFECFDSDGSGYVSMTEFAALVVKDRHVAKLLGIDGVGRAGRGRSSNSDAVFKKMCGESEREVSWPAFQRYLAEHSLSVIRKQDSEEDRKAPARLQILPEDEKARFIFEAIDTDENGVISWAELAAACVKRPKVAEFIVSASGRCERSGCRRPSADKLFKEMDTDGDYVISMDEFLCYVNRQHCLWCAPAGSCGGCS